MAITRIDSLEIRLYTVSKHKILMRWMGKMMKSQLHRAVQGDTVCIRVDEKITKKLRIGENKNACMEYACIGKHEGETFEFFGHNVRVLELNEGENTKKYPPEKIPKIKDFYILPDDKSTQETENIKFGYVNEATERELNVLFWQQKVERDESDEISVKVIGHNYVRTRNYQKQRSTIDEDIREYRKFRLEPYRIRLDYKNKDTGEILNIYVGLHDVGDSDGQHVLSWNDSFSQIVWQDVWGRIAIRPKIQGNGNDRLERLLHDNSSTVTCNGVEYQLLLRRTYSFNDWEKGVIFEEEYDIRENAEITDPLLHIILADKRRHHEMTNIVFSIQAKQREIMNLPQDKNIIVQGCAGSGKTMILLHRISLLLNDYPELKAENILILTPNQLFNESLQGVSAELEITKVKRKSIDMFYQEILKSYLSEWEATEEWKDETQIYTDNELKTLYSRKTFADVLIEERHVLTDEEATVEKLFEEIKSLLQRNEIVKRTNTNSKDRYFNQVVGILEKLAERVKEARSGVSRIGQKIENDERRIEESTNLATDARKKVLGVTVGMLAKLQERKDECEKRREELDAGYKNLCSELERAKQSRENKSYISSTGEIDIALMKASEDTDVQRMAKKIQELTAEEEKLEKQKSKLTAYNVSQKIELQRKILECETELALIVEEIPKVEDRLTIEQENEKKKQIVELQREIKQNNSSMAVCIKCLETMKKTDEEWPDLTRIEGHEIISDVIEEYQKVKETIRIQTGRANNIRKEIDAAKQELDKLNNQLPTNEENKIIRQLNEKIESFSPTVLMKQVIAEIYKRQKIKIHENCRIYILFMIWMCREYYNRRRNIKNKIVCIDEVQDVSTVEVELLKNVLPEETKWNLYGDMMQRSTIYKEELSNKNFWEPLTKLVNADFYSLDVNYRNAVEIVRYCNEVFQKNITPMGIKGDVLEGGLSGCLTEFEKDIQRASDSEEFPGVAIILKNLEPSSISLYKDEIESWTNLEVSVGKIVEGKIPILDVKMAKGMEFRYVVVDPEEMTENDKYIAYTRAMEKLYIVEE